MKLTARQLKEGLHKGFNYAQFAERYQCTEEEVRNSINIVYKHNENDRNKILREFEKNAKRKIKATTECVEVEKAEDNNNIETVDKQEKSQKSEAFNLTQLLAQEKTISDEVQDLELSHKDLHSEHRAKKAELVEIHEKLVDLKDQFRQTLGKFNLKNEEIEALAGEISKMNSEIQKRKAVLDGVRDSIKALTAVTIFVYDDGEIEVSKNAPEITIAEDTNLMSQLLEDTLCQELRLKDIRVLANAIIMNRAYRGLKFETQFIFDNELMEQIFCSF